MRRHQQQQRDAECYGACRRDVTHIKTWECVAAPCSSSARAGSSPWPPWACAPVTRPPSRRPRHPAGSAQRQAGRGEPSAAIRAGARQAGPRHLPQCPHPDRRAVARRARPGGGRQPLGRLGKGDREAARRHDAACGHAATRRGHTARVRGLARAADRRAGADLAGPGTQADPPPEPHRVRQRRARPAGPAGRRHGPPARR